MHQFPEYMQMALDLAAHGVGRTAPNPPVGAILVKDGEVVGRGYHLAAGEPHAEVFALREAGEAARGAELYVTLEPCCHQGRTGPCTQAVIDAGVRRVVIGTLDPNPLVAGKGVHILRDAGVEVVTGELEGECRRLIAPFAKQITTGLPFVMAKSAMTLDGRTATSTGESQWISCEESRRVVHQLRDRVDGIMVGSRTVLTDNPRLTTRLPEGGGRNPVRIVVDGQLITPAEAAVYEKTASDRVLLLTSREHDAEAIAPYVERGVEVLAVAMQDEHLDLYDAMQQLGRENLQTILLEGGSQLNNAMLQAGLIDRVMLFIAPMLFGGNDGDALFKGPGVKRLAEATRLTDLRLSRVGADILIEGEVAKCSPD